jgi:hypothetical protein
MTGLAGNWRKITIPLLRLLRLHLILLGYAPIHP